MTQSGIQQKLQRWLKDFYDIKELDLPEGLSKYLSSRISDVIEVRDDPNVVNFTWGGEPVKARVTSHSAEMIQLTGVDDDFDMIASCKALISAGVKESRLASILDALDGSADGIIELNITQEG